MKGVIFDFNGTMFFDSPLHLKAWKERAKIYFGKNLTDREVEQNIQGRSNHLILSYLSSSPLSEEEERRIGLEKEKRYRKLVRENPSLSLAPGLLSFLSLLKEHQVPRAIATSSEKTNRAFYLKTFPLLEYFEKTNIVYDDGSFTKGKPDPEIYQVAIRRLGLHPLDCVIFEDSLSGLESAYKAKAGRIVLVKDNSYPPSFPLPSYVDATIDSYVPRKREILDFIGI